MRLAGGKNENLIDQRDPMPGPIEHDAIPQTDQRHAEPQRRPGMPCWQGVLDSLEFLQEKPKLRYHKAESHESQTGPNPCQKSPLSGQRIAQIGLWPKLPRRIHRAGCQTTSWSAPVFLQYAVIVIGQAPANEIVTHA